MFVRLFVCCVEKCFCKVFLSRSRRNWSSKASAVVVGRDSRSPRTRAYGTLSYHAPVTHVAMDKIPNHIMLFPANDSWFLTRNWCESHTHFWKTDEDDNDDVVDSPICAQSRHWITHFTQALGIGHDCEMRSLLRSSTASTKS